mmetsp:Transcript_4084/g.25688  ORF Transcript_4084/g.25688 Transcript_4084/m.25688 type:complete len:209 (-) Transcript_4084:343-969(-)
MYGRLRPVLLQGTRQSSPRPSSWSDETRNACFSASWLEQTWTFLAFRDGSAGFVNAYLLGRAPCHAVLPWVGLCTALLLAPGGRDVVEQAVGRHRLQGWIQGHAPRHCKRRLPFSRLPLHGLAHSSVVRRCIQVHPSLVWQCIPTRLHLEWWCVPAHPRSVSQEAARLSLLVFAGMLHRSCPLLPRLDPSSLPPQEARGFRLARARVR